MPMKRKIIGFFTFFKKTGNYAIFRRIILSEGGQTDALNTKKERSKKMTNETKKMLILIGMIVYILSPVDCLPGPVDDIIVAIAGIITSRRLSAPRGNDGE